MMMVKLQWFPPAYDIISNGVIRMIKNIITLLSVYLMLPNGLGLAADLHFDVSPRKCVTLKQGNQCYQDIDVNWQAREKGDYCLIVSTQDTPLKCWIDQDAADFEFEFVGKQTALLSLVESKSGKLLQQTDIEVKWVYRNRSRNLSWRVF